MQGQSPTCCYCRGNCSGASAPNCCFPARSYADAYSKAQAWACPRVRLLLSPACRYADAYSNPSTPGVGTPSRMRRGPSAAPAGDPGLSGMGSLTPSASAEDMVGVEDLQPCANPEGMLQGVLQQLGEANVAKRKELDWQAQNQVCGPQTLRSAPPGDLHQRAEATAHAATSHTTPCLAGSQ